MVFTVQEKMSGRPQVKNETVLEFAQQNSDIMMAFISIDPTRGAEGVAEAKDLLKTGLVRGLKLHPPIQNFFPSDRIAYPLYELFQEARLPVLFHTGHSGIGTGIQFSPTTGAITNASSLGYANATLPNRILAFTARLQF